MSFVLIVLAVMLGIYLSPLAGDLLYIGWVLIQLAIPVIAIGGILLLAKSSDGPPPLAWSLIGLAVLGGIGYLCERAERAKDDDELP